jgi:hypothetical protein
MRLDEPNERLAVSTLPSVYADLQSVNENVLAGLRAKPLRNVGLSERRAARKCVPKRRIFSFTLPSPIPRITVQLRRKEIQ